MTPNVFRSAAPGNPTNCAEEEGTGCIATPTSDSIVPQPLIDNPTNCTGQRTDKPARSTDLRRSHPSLRSHGHLSADRRLPARGIQTGPARQSHHHRHRFGLRPRRRSQLSQFLTFAAEPSEIKAATVTLPEGFTINPDAADGQTACSDVQAKFNSEGPAECPDQSKIGTFSIGTPALPERLEGSVYIGEPQPGNQYRLFLPPRVSG